MPPDTSAPAQASTTTQPVQPTRPLDEVRRRLQAAGLTPQEAETGGTAVVDSLDVESVSIVAFRTPASARKATDEIARVLEQAPDRGRVERIGTRMYWTKQQRSLTRAEKDFFARVLAVDR